MRRVLTILAIACAGVAGCGGDDDEDKGGGPEAEVRTVVREHLTAVAAGNAKVACQTLTAAGQDALVEEVTAAFADGGRMSCNDAVVEVAADIATEDKRVLFEPKIRKVSINGSTASADVERIAGPVPLRRVGDEWLVDRSTFDVQR